MELYSEKDRFISILSDYGFKATFGNESNTLFLRHALQALIGSAVPIKKIEFIKNTLDGFTVDSRSGVYDLSCTDENGNHFIVEMQLNSFPNFIHRMKFYALYKYNTLVKKGKYSFEGIPKIYCIGILANTIFPKIKDYHNFATLKNQKGEQIDDQIAFIVVELDKFTKRLKNISSDLDKLIYTMKTLHKVKTQRQFPPFWNEEWLKSAIEELDRKSMTPEKRLAYEMLIAQNAAVIYEEKKKMDELRMKSVKNALLRAKLTIEEIAEDNDVSIDFVLDVQKSISAK